MQVEDQDTYQSKISLESQTGQTIVLPGTLGDSEKSVTDKFLTRTELNALTVPYNSNNSRHTGKGPNLFQLQFIVNQSISCCTG